MKREEPNSAAASVIIIQTAKRSVPRLLWLLSSFFLVWPNKVLTVSELMFELESNAINSNWHVHYFPSFSLPWDIFQKSMRSIVRDQLHFVPHGPFKSSSNWRQWCPLRMWKEKLAVLHLENKGGFLLSLFLRDIDITREGETRQRFFEFKFWSRVSKKLPSFCIFDASHLFS